MGRSRRLRVLLDTHTLIWWWARYPKIRGTRSFAVINDAATDIFVSAATGWEIATKNRTRGIDLPVSIEQLEDAIRDEGFITLDVTMTHAIHAGNYDAEHRDPFDRLLAAQAEIEGLTLLTADPAFAAFPCLTLWH